MLKSIIIVDDYAYINGGAASVAIQSAIHLANNTPYDVYYFSAVGPACDELKNAKFKQLICLEQYDLLHNPNKISAFVNGIWNKEAKTRFSKFLHKFSPDTTIIHVHTWTKAFSSSIFSAAKKIDIKVVVTLHDYFVNCPNGGYFNYTNSQICTLKPMSVKCLLTNCDSRRYYFKLWRVLRQYVQNQYIKDSKNISYIAVSEFSKDRIQNRSPELEDITIINNPVKFSNRHQINVITNNTYLFIGRLSEEKGIRLFCNTMRNMNLNAVIVGDGPLKEELVKEFQSDKIIFTGWLSRFQINGYLKSVRCLVFTSLWYETLGLTVLEAQSRGIPCLVGNQTAASELIRDNVNGLLFKGGDQNSLENVIAKTFNDDLIKTLSENAYNDFDLIRYDINVHVQLLTDYYEKSLLSKHEII